jgi:hypothetical protein
VKFEIFLPYVVFLEIARGEVAVYGVRFYLDVRKLRRRLVLWLRCSGFNMYG